MQVKMYRVSEESEKSNTRDDIISRDDTLADRRRIIARRELAWHKQEARRRYPLDALLYDPPAFDAVLRSGIEFLQPRIGELVLDLGCGEGKETAELASRELLVVAIDLSGAELSRARGLLRKRCPDARTCFIQANAEALPFADSSFRLIYGKAILHHLDLYLSAQEVGRLLKRGGRATFAEPLAHHPLFWLSRRLTPKLRTRDETPVTFRDLSEYRGNFRSSTVEVYFLIAPLAYLVRILPNGETAFRKLHAFLQRADNWFLGHFPAMAKLAWYGVLKAEK